MAGGSTNDKYQDLVKSAQLLDPSKWTADKISNITFGDDCITKMATTLRLPIDEC